jgi:predicted NUDIX family phosphoesterase
MANYDNGEQVLVVPRESIADLIDDGPTCGFRPGGLAAVSERIGRDGRFMPRAAVEEDPRFKQPIPYGVLFCGDEVFMLQRTRAGGDARLYDRVSLGVGGHINPCDGSPVDGSSSAAVAAVGPVLAAAPERALHRELREELDAPAEYTLTGLGLLNDESNDVGRVHLGLVYSIEVREPLVSVRERELLAGGFRSVDEVSRKVEQMETWSSILWRYWLADGQGLPPLQLLREAGSERNPGLL